jgi:hypothetical protein
MLMIALEVIVVVVVAVVVLYSVVVTALCPRARRRGLEVRRPWVGLCTPCGPRRS